MRTATRAMMSGGAAAALVVLMSLPVVAAGYAETYWEMGSYNGYRACAHVDVYATSGLQSAGGESWARWFSANCGSVGDANTYSYNGAYVQLRRLSGGTWQLCNDDTVALGTRLTAYALALNGICSGTGSFRGFSQHTVWLSGQEFTNWCGGCFPLVSPQEDV